MFCDDVAGQAAIKIGRTIDPLKRFAAVRSSCPAPIKHFAWVHVEGRELAMQIEAELHAAFAHRRLHGEWFRFDTKNAGDKAEFNAGWKAVFAHLPPKGRWIQVNARELERYLDKDGKLRRLFYESRSTQRVKLLRDNKHF